MTTLPMLQRRTLQAISEKSKKSLPAIAVRALLDKGLIVETDPLGNPRYVTTDAGEKALEDNGAS